MKCKLKLLYDTISPQSEQLSSINLTTNVAEDEQRKEPIITVHGGGVVKINIAIEKFNLEFPEK